MTSDPVDGPDGPPEEPDADPESVARKILLDQLTGQARSRSELAGKLAQAPTRAIGLMKRAFNRSFRVTLEDQLSYEADLQAVAARTADFHEGVQAFLDKRAAVFRGR